MAHTTREITHDEAMRVLRAEYYQDVTSMAEDLRDRVQRGEIASEEDLSDAVHDDVDGSAWVIYTGKNMQVLLVSDNSDAYFDEGMGNGEDLVSKDGIRWEFLAYWALYRDVWEALDLLGIDHSYDFDGQGDEAEEESEEAVHAS